MITHTPYFLKQTQKKPVQNRVRTSIPTFLVKTYEMLDNQDHKDIVCWSDDGKSFLIKKHNEFRDQVLPQYFKHNNYSSFVRQLNMYDFHKVRNESTDSEYKNPLFQRGQQKMLSDIKRKSGDNNLNDEFSTQQNDNNEDSGQLHQTHSGNNLNLDSDKSDNSQILSEVSNLKSKQTNLEKAMTMLIQQHETLIRENKILWDEIRRQNEQDDLRSEKIMMVLAFFLNRNNQFNNGSGNNNNNNLQSQKSLALQHMNNRRSYQPSLEDFQSLLQGQSYQQNKQSDQLQNIYKDLNNLNKGQFPFDINEKQMYSLPFNKNKKGGNESFAPQLGQKQIRKILEAYQSGGNSDREKIERYLQQMIIGQNNSNSTNENRSNFLQIEPLSPMSSSGIKHEKPSISLFENPATKRICDDSMNPLKPYDNNDNGLSGLIKNSQKGGGNSDIHLSPFEQQIVAFGKGGNSNSQIRNTSQPKISSAHSIEHFPFDNQNNQNNINSIFKDNMYNIPSPNIHALTNNLGNNNNQLFSLSRTNSTNGLSGFNHDKLLLENTLSQNPRYSPSPQRISNNDLTHSQTNIGDHPVLYLNNFFTPEHHYHEDEDFNARSRRSSFDKNHDQSNNFSNIN